MDTNTYESEAAREHAAPYAPLATMASGNHVRSVLLAVDDTSRDIGAVRAARSLVTAAAAQLRVVALADAARQASADLLVVGLPRARNVSALAPHLDGVLRTIRRATMPVLVASDELRVPIQTCVAGIDFSPSSVHAARVALSLLAPGGALYLVHVEPHFDDTGHGLEGRYAQGICGAFDRLVGSFRGDTHARVETVLLRGHAREELVRYADRVGADLITLGSSSLDLARFSGMRVSTSLLRSGTHSVLIGPRAPQQSGVHRSSAAH